MRPHSLWRDPDFLKLWAGQAVSQIGSWITLVGLPLTAVLVLGASPLQMGLLSGAGAAAVLVFGLFAGAWADRLRRRPILIAADLGRAAVLGTIPLAVTLHRLTMGHLYLVAAASAVLTVFFDVSYQAYLPALVSRENILEGNSKLALTDSIAGIAGPGLTGVLVQAITAPIAAKMSNIEVIGLVLYTRYVYFFEAAGMILLVAMVGAIVLTLQHRVRVRRQNIFEQNARTPGTAMEVLKVRSGQGLGSNT